MLSLRILRTIRVATTPHFGRTVSSFKRRTAPLPPDQLEQLKSTYFQSRTSLDKTEWAIVRQSLIDSYKHINRNNIDAVIVGVCNTDVQLPLAKDYIRYLREIGIEPNDATLGRLLRVYNAAYHERGGTPFSLTATEQLEICEICANLKSKHELLDATTCENIIHGLVATDKWLDAQQLLDMIKLTSTPSIAAYTELAVKAYSMQNSNLGWQLLDEIANIGKQPKCDIYLACLGQTKSLNELEKLLQFLEHHDLHITRIVAEALMQWVAKHLSHEAAATNAMPVRLNTLGKCLNCTQHLQHIAIGDIEFERLRDSFLEKVLIRKDVFQKSTPAEVARFKQYVEQTAPYDCVIDGLNVAYSTGTKKPPQELAKLLAVVVRYFKERNKHVLVLGRKHMRNWSKPAMNYVSNNASLFLTDNLTHDDPFLLYATLKSGSSTDFFSRDLMRSHAFLLGSELKPIFRRWQQEHQYSLVTQTGSGKIIIKEPIRYRMSTHKVAETWHIPFRETYSSNPGESFEVPEQWLCLKVK